MSINKDAPHQVAILVRYELMERDKVGRLAKPVECKSFTFTITGNSYDEVKTQLTDFLEVINNDRNKPT